MLKNLFQSKEDKLREKVEEHITEGMKLLSEKFYNGAMIEFDKAMELDPESIYPRLVNELEMAASSGALESALAIGLNLIKENNQDYILANKLGNYARELKDYKQADALYKSALRVKKNFEMAFYNLAASQAKVDVYDEAAKSSISIFDEAEGYVLPDYKGESKLVEVYSEYILEHKEEDTRDKIQLLTDERQQKLETGYNTEATELAKQIKDLEASTKIVLPEDIFSHFRKLISEQPENEKQHLFNLSIYALSVNEPDIAVESMASLSTREFETLDLLKAISIALKGDLESAIGRLVKLLGDNEFNRYYNVNIGLMYRKQGKKFLSSKYLIKTAHLLDKSNGIYSMKDLVKLANKTFQEGNLKKALHYFQVASTELPDPDVWYKIGLIFVERKKYDDAVLAFRELLKLDPKSTIGDDKLMEIHNYYFEKGEALLEDRKFKPSADYMLKALDVRRELSTLKKLAVVYKQMNSSEKEKEVLEEIVQIEEREKAIENEKKRKVLIAHGKQFMLKKNYLKAIEHFESALRMKVDKNIFVQLVKLYKGLKKHAELQNLVQRWEKMIEHEEKMRRFEKDKERERKNEAQNLK